MKTWQRYAPVIGSFVFSIWATPTIFLTSVTNYTGETMFISKNRHHHGFETIPACDDDKKPLTLQLNSHLMPEEFTVFTQDDYCVSKIHSKPYVYLKTVFNQNTNVVSALLYKRNALKQPLHKKIFTAQCEDFTTHCCISLKLAVHFNYPQVDIQPFTGDIPAMLKSSLVHQPKPRYPRSTHIAQVLKEHRTIAFSDVDRYFAHDGKELIR